MFRVYSARQELFCFDLIRSVQDHTLGLHSKFFDANQQFHLKRRDTNRLID